MTRDNNPDRLDDGVRAGAEMNAQWCQPMKNGEHTPRQFIVYYEDAEIGIAAFDNEAEAREHWERAKDNWNCYLFGSLPSALPAPQGDDGLVGEVLANIEQWNKWATEWAGSAFVAGERLPKDGMTESEHKSELYSGLCKMMNHMSWLHDQVTALRAQAAEIAGLKAKLFPYADDTEISGMSWNGFYLIGNQKSIKELQRIENRSAQVEVYRKAFDERIEAAEAHLTSAMEALTEIATAPQGGIRAARIARTTLSSIKGSAE